MKVELAIVRDCAHAEAAGVVLAHALAAEGLPPHFDVVLVDTPEDARALGFLGSPAFLVDGRDVFAPEGAVPGLACRIYPTARGSAGLPDESDLRRVLRSLSR